MVGEALQRGELRRDFAFWIRPASHSAGRKTNIDGYFVLCTGRGRFHRQAEPGRVIQASIQSNTGQPTNRSARFGSLSVARMLHFQVGPSEDGGYKTFFHTAIRESNKGMGFGVMATGGTGNGERWVRFDNFRVTRAIAVWLGEIAYSPPSLTVSLRRLFTSARWSHA